MQARRFGRFVSATEVDRAAQALDLPALQAEAIRSTADQREQGRKALAELLSRAAQGVPAYRELRAIPEPRLTDFPFRSRSDLGSLDLLAEGAQPSRWNRTSGSTNTPVRTALGPRHEHHQIVKWCRQWAAVGVDRPSAVTMVTPRSYRLRLLGGGELIDLSGGHTVTQLHPGSTDLTAAYQADALVANPHLLPQLFHGQEVTTPVLVTSYEQRLPATDSPIHGRVEGDVYGLSEVGDVAFQRVGDHVWHIHDDLVLVEPLDASLAEGDGVLSEIVVTDLTNHVMPLIRYRTGDLGVFGPGTESRELRSVIGRRVAARGTCLAGVDIFTAVLPALLDASRQFRLAADSGRAVALLEGAGPEDRAMAARRLSRVGVRVTFDPAELDGLSEVLVDPRGPGA